MSADQPNRFLAAKNNRFWRVLFLGEKVSITARAAGRQSSACGGGTTGKVAALSKSSKIRKAGVKVEFYELLQTGNFAGRWLRYDGSQLAQEARSLTRFLLELGVLNKTLTVVLPVFNGESRLRKSVHEILELASELTSKFGVLIIDDGSDDSTYEVAEELAATYPQVSVRRHRQFQGLGRTIDYIQRNVRSDAVIMHDGASPIDAREMRKLWCNWVAGTGSPSDRPKIGELHEAMRELANLPSIHAAMEKAHRRITGFQLITPVDAEEAPAVETPIHATPTAAERRANASIDRRSLGKIPTLPRPKFLSALANFTLGE